MKETVLVNNIKGYHTNYKHKCDSFMSGDELIISKDTCFLGTGMYFWDTKSNAEYWKEVKTRQNPRKEVCITESNIILENVLDVMDKNVRLFIQKSWEKYIKKVHNVEYKKYNSVKLGQVLDTLPVVKDIPVRKGIFNYSDEFYSLGGIESGISNCKLSNISRTIYAVRENELVVDRKYIE